jgi:hypothetical protein
MSSSRLLGIYLNDQYAGATLSLALARRALRENRGTPFEDFLERLAGETAEDRQALRDLMDRLGVRRSRVKPALALGAERLGRLKPNGRLVSYSPLSRLLELEGLILGVAGKRSVWRAVRQLDRDLGVDLDELERRADEQLAELEQHRDQAARLALR